MFTKQPKYYFNSEAMKEPVAASQVGRVRADKFGGNKGDIVNHSPGSIYRKGRGGKNAFRGQGHFREGENGPANREGRDMADVGAGETRNRRSVWTVATTPFKGAHFATFPTKLIEPCVLASTRPGDTIIDPFGGAGTTGLVAQQHSRSAILCELNTEYAAMAAQRLGQIPILEDDQ
jgi:DNA modification methylase